MVVIVLENSYVKIFCVQQGEDLVTDSNTSKCLTYYVSAEKRKNYGGHRLSTHIVGFLAFLGLAFQIFNNFRKLTQKGCSNPVQQH